MMDTCVLQIGMILQRLPGKVWVNVWRLSEDVQGQTSENGKRVHQESANECLRSWRVTANQILQRIAQRNEELFRYTRWTDVLVGIFDGNTPEGEMIFRGIVRARCN